MMYTVIVYHVTAAVGAECFVSGLRPAPLSFPLSSPLSQDPHMDNAAQALQPPTLDMPSYNEKPAAARENLSNGRSHLQTSRRLECKNKQPVPGLRHSDRTWTNLHFDWLYPPGKADRNVARQVLYVGLSLLSRANQDSDSAILITIFVYILAAVQVIRINIAPHFATHLSYAAVQTYHADVSQRIYHIRSCTCDNKSYSAGHCTSVVHTSGAVVYTITDPPGFLPSASSSSFCGRAAYRLDDEISPPKANRASTVSGMQRE